MADPVLRRRVTLTSDDQIACYSNWLWCPGCNITHNITTPHPDATAPPSPDRLWDFDGNEESPTFSPSLLVHHSVHLCPPDYVHEEECAAYPNCGHIGHGIGPNGEMMKRKPCIASPNYGNCHSFIRNGVWEFLGDSAHKLAGQHIPMVPIPEHYAALFD
jgi:hypothetical protein